MNRALIAVAVLAVAGVVGLVVAASQIDVEQYREAVAAEIEARTGRKVQLGHDLEVQWGLAPTFSAKGFWIANAGWSRQPQMFSVGQARTKVRLLPLLSGRIEIEALTLSAVALRLETSPDGQVNWHFAMLRPDEDTGEDGEEALVDVALAGPVRLERSTLTVWDGSSDTGRTVYVEALTLTPADGGARVALEGTVQINGVAVAVDGEMPAPWAPEPAVADARRYSLAMRGEGLSWRQAGPFPETFDGHIEPTELDVQLRAGNELARLLGAPLPELAPLALRAQVAGSKEALHVTGLRLARADQVVEGDVRLTTDGARPRLEGALRSDWLAFGGGAGDASAPPRPGPGAGAAPRLISDEPLPLGDVPARGLGSLGVDADLKLAVARLVLGSTELRAVSTRARLEGDSLRLDDLNLTVAGSRAAGSAGFTVRAGSPPRAYLDLDAPGVHLPALLALLDLDLEVQGKADLRAKLKGAGNSPAALAAGLDGEVALDLVEASANLDGLDTMVGGLSSLGTHKGGDGERSEWTRFNCGAASLQFEEGVADTRFLLDSPRAVLVGKGEISLRDERLDLHLTPEPKSVTLNVSVPVVVSGPLAEPDVSPEAAGTARRLGGAIGTLLFPPAALIAFVDAGGDDPCLAGAAAAVTAARSKEGSKSSRKAAGSRKRETFESADSMSDAAESSGTRSRGGHSESVGDVFQSIGDGIKGLFND